MRADLLEKARRLDEKAHAVAAEAPALEAGLAAATQALRSAEMPEAPLTAGERRKISAAYVAAIEQDVDLARYQAGNRRRRLETLRAEIESVEERVRDAAADGAAAEAKQRAAEAGLSGPDAVRARQDLVVAKMSVLVAARRSAYVDTLQKSRALRLAIAEREARTQDALLRKKLDELTAARSILGVSRDEAARRKQEIDAQRSAIEAGLAGREEEMRRAMEEELQAEKQFKTMEQQAQGAAKRPSDEDVSLARTRWDTALEKRKAIAEEIARDRLDIELGAARSAVWDELLKVSEAPGPARSRLARRQRDLAREMQAAIDEKRRAAGELARIARDDVAQIEEGIGYSKARKASMDEMPDERPEDRARATAVAKDLDLVVASLSEAAGFATRRLEALEDGDRLLEKQAEFASEVLARMEPLAGDDAGRVTIQSFADLGASLVAAARALGTIGLHAGQERRELAAYLAEGGRGAALGRAIGSIATLALLGGLLAWVVARALGRVLLGHTEKGALRGSLTFARHAVTPLVIAGVVFVGLLPGRPEAPAPADASIDARYARLGATVHETVRTAALAVATMLALTAIGRTIEAVGLPGPSLVRWSFLLFWARGGFLSWLGLSLWARLALLFGAPSSVPFLVTSLARIVLLVMGGLVVGRLRHEIVALFEVHQISDAGETQDGAIAVTYNRMVHALGSFVAIYALGIVAVYALGHVELAGTLLFASLETFAILVLGFGLERLLHLLFRSRFKELDRIEALTGQPHALAREVLRASYMLLTLGVILLTTTVVLLCWGIRPDAAWTATRDALRRELVTINGTPLTLGSLLTFAAIVGGAFVVSRALRRFLARQVFPRSKVDKGVQHALSTILNYVILLAAGFMGFQSLGFDLTTLKVIVGAVGLGIGFGLQNIAANFISGLIILLERPINIDDVVEVSGTLGRIETVSARATHVRTRDNITVIVPNTEFISSRVVNWSHRDPRMRIHVAVGVAYGTPAGKVRETLLGVARGDRRVLHKPEPEVRLTGFGESAMAFQLLAWISDPWESERILSDLNYAVDEAFQREGIRIPFPQREVHVVDGRLPAALHGPEGSDAEARKHGGV